MNTGPVVTGDAELGLVQRALCALAGTAGVGGHVLEEDGLLANGVTADALVELTAAGVTYPYAVETTRVDRFGRGSWSRRGSPRRPRSSVESLGCSSSISRGTHTCTSATSMSSSRVRS